MAITNFIPEIWNASMLENFREKTLAASIANREYEGDASKGNTVKITGANDVDVFDYSIGEANGGTVGVPLARTTAAQAVSDTTQDLLIDQEKNFDFYVDDIDRAQAAGGLDAFTRSAGYGLAKDADVFLWNLAADAATLVSGTHTADGDYTPDELHAVIRDMRKDLNKQFVPMDGRYLVINAEFEAVLLDAASKLTSFDTSGSPAGLREATLGRYLGFTIITTEHLPVVDAPYALALRGQSLAFVSQIDKTEAMRAQDKFADRLRGLHVYGGKVIDRPNLDNGVVFFDGTDVIP